MPSHSTNQSELNVLVPGSPSALRTWLFDAETSDDDDSHISFPNRHLTTSTTSTKPDSVSEYLIDTDSELGPGCSSPSLCPIANSRSQREVETADEEAALDSEFNSPNTPWFATPVSDLGPDPRQETSEVNIPSLRTEVNPALCHKIRALKHYAHWSYRQIAAATGVALSTVYRIAHPPLTPTHSKMCGRHAILRSPHREKLIILATSSAENRRKPYLEIARMAGLTVCDRTLRRTMTSAGYHQRVARKKPYLSNITRQVSLPSPSPPLLQSLLLPIPGADKSLFPARCCKI